MIAALIRWSARNVLLIGIATVFVTFAGVYAVSRVPLDAIPALSHVRRGFFFFGLSFVYVIFEDATDLYWARSRVLEYLNSAARRLPAGVAPSLGSDATGVG